MEIRAAEPGDVDGAIALHDAHRAVLGGHAGRVDAQAGVAAPFRAAERSPRWTPARWSAWATTALIAGSDPLDGQLRVLVRPDHRGRGIGAKLLEATHEDLRAAGATTRAGVRRSGDGRVGGAVGLPADPAGALRGDRPAQGAGRPGRPDRRGAGAADRGRPAAALRGRSSCPAHQTGRREDHLTAVRRLARRDLAVAGHGARPQRGRAVRGPDRSRSRSATAIAPGSGRR